MKLRFVVGQLAVVPLLFGCLGLNNPFDSSSSSTATPAATANPVPGIASISPKAVAARAASFQLVVQGTHFVPGAAVKWNGSGLTTRYDSDSQLTATVPGSAVAQAGAVNISVNNPAPGGGSSVAATLDVNQVNPVPAISGLMPPSATAGGPSFALTVNGSGFVSSSTVEWNGAALATSYVSDTRLTAMVPAQDIAQGGSAGVTVGTPAPGGGVSFAAAFDVTNSNPLPAISTVAPSSAPAGSGQLVISVAGGGFVASSAVTWNGAALPTSFVDSGHLTATVPASLVANSGSAAVAVGNPAPGGGSSGSLSFVIASVNPVPAVSALSPSSEVAGSGSFSLTVMGSGFVPSSVLNWNGSPVASTYVSSSKITAQIQAAAIAAAGSAALSVTTPAPGGGTSAALNFSIVSSNPAPQLSSISPSSVAAGSAAFTLTAAGSQFMSSSVINWNGTPLATSYVSSTKITAMVPASDVAVGGAASVTVTNPAPGGGNSTASSLAITASNPVPAVSGISPGSVAAGGTSFTLTVNGGNFVSGSRVDWNGSPLPTTYVSASTLTASVPASDVAAAGSSSVTVTNPAPGGGSSAASPFKVLASGGSVPGAPTALIAFATTQGATIVFAAPAGNGGAALTQYTATASPGGQTASSSLVTSPVTAVSARIDMNGLTPGVSYTFTVSAANASGSGPESAASNAVTPLAYSDYWVADGGTLTGKNPQWGDYSYAGTAYWGVAPGTLAHNGSGFSAPSPVTAGTNVTEFDVTSSYGGLQPYFMHVNPSNAANGRFNLAPYNYLTFSVWPTASGQRLAIFFMHSYWFNGVASAGTNSATSLTDIGEDWTPNQFADGTWYIRDNTANFYPMQITSNTTNQLTLNSAPTAIAAGDYYEIDKADQPAGQNVELPNAAYGPATMTAGAWNTYTVPLTAFDAPGSPIAGNFVLKFAIVDATAVPVNTLYYSNIGLRR